MAYKQARKEIKYEVHIRDGWRCVYCGNFGNQIDHVIPWQHGGKNIKANLVTSCKTCNKKKGHKLIAEMITKAFQHLISVGESLDWVDSI